ncbi:MAG: M28 family peptidase [Clostridia bacterium]|nr:M28 family peptidase [Clostridia bacterium]
MIQNKPLNNKFVASISLQLMVVMTTMVMITAGCNNEQRQQAGSSVETQKPLLQVPQFDADSAYAYVKQQVDFGPRVPETEAHAAAVAWITQSLQQWADTVLVQDFVTRVYDNRIFNGKNIIASYNPGSKNRIFLSAHYDSRPYADHDADASNHKTPIDGANDGASGTGVLMELARQLHLHPVSRGIDIILFDLEDYGPPQDTQTDQGSDSWGLGSQHWSANPHQPNYNARYGILLDMVGAADATFPLEGFSMYYAPDITKRVWETAAAAGYGDYFVFEKGTYITDDHYFVNTIANIPTLNIIHLEPGSVNGTFYDHWHTTSDDITQIEPATLKAVGQTLLAVIYQKSF